MSKTLNTERVLLLASVARHGTMTLAADAMNYSTSAISQQIRKLEIEADQPLLQRHSRGIQLTDAGRSVVEHAEQIEGRLKSLQASLDDIAGLRAGSLLIGTFPTAGSSLLPLAIGRFRNAHPGVRLTVRSYRLATLIQMMTERDISLSLLWDYDWSRLELSEFEMHHLLDDPSDLVVSSSHPLANRESVSMSELADESWVVRAGEHPMIEVLTRAANRVGFQPDIAFAANDYQEAQAMVAVGLGIALVPRLALNFQRDDVEVIPFADEAPKRRVLMARMKDATPSAAEKAMMKMLLTAARQTQEGTTNQHHRRGSPNSRKA